MSAFVRRWPRCITVLVLLPAVMFIAMAEIGWHLGVGWELGFFPVGPLAAFFLASRAAEADMRAAENTS